MKTERTTQRNNERADSLKRLTVWQTCSWDYTEERKLRAFPLKSEMRQECLLSLNIMLDFLARK
jgi:hypothetical protein